MGAVSTAFYQAVLRELRAPLTRENLRALLAWQRAEGGHASYNPFNTTMPAAGATWYNTFGAQGQYHVRNYPDAETGIGATVATLRNSRYDTITRHLRAGSSGLTVCHAVDASPWGTHGAAREYLQLYGSTPTARPPTRRVLRVTAPLMHGSDVRQVQERLARAGHSPGVADSFYGRNTRRAAAAFQAQHHLTDDGIVGPLTWHALGFA